MTTPPDFPTETEVILKVWDAAEKLLNLDRHLLQIDIHERTIAHQFAIYLGELFSPPWDIDCEYNRNHNIPKVLRIHADVLRRYEKKVKKGDLNDVSVYPDIIIHRRGSDGNIVVIEIKKTTSGIDEEFDMLKLYYFEMQLHYRYPFFIRFTTNQEEVGVEIHYVPNRKVTIIDRDLIERIRSDMSHGND